MKVMMLVRWGLFFVALMGVAACGTDEDVTAPVQEFEFIFPEARARDICGVVEAKVYVLNDTQQLEMRLRLSDDEQLSELKVDIHANFDCHGHGGVGSIGRPAVEGATDDWRVLRITELAGQEQIELLQLSPPEFATAGPYHMSLQIVDASGNQSDAQFFTLYLQNHLDTLGPELILDSPSEPGDLGDVERGEILVFSGTMSDNRSLQDGGNGVLYLVYQDLSSGNYFQGPHIIPQGTDPTVEDFNMSFEVPQSLVRGRYNLILRAADGLNNLSEPVTFTFRIP